MSKITTFTRENLGMLRGEIQAALDAVGAKHGISLQMKNITFDPTGATFRAPIEAKAGGFEDVARNQALSYARSFCEVDASEPSEHIRVKGAVLVEFLPTKRSKPWVYELGGKRYVTDDVSLKVMWPKVAEEAPPLG